MPTYKFRARRTASGGDVDTDEEVLEWGIIVATSESNAGDKLRLRGLVPLKIREIRGIRGFFARFRADIK